MKYKKNIIGCIALLVAMLLSSRISAQENTDTAVVTVGQKIPSYLWDTAFKMLRPVAGKKKGLELVDMKLNEHKGKLIILDFWATWCGACIAKFPKMVSLQERMKEKLAVVMVTYQTPDLVEKVLLQRQNDENEFISSIVSDKLLDKMFPKRTIPHYVWISGDGTVIGTTESDQLTDSNINAAIKSDGSKIKNVIDVDSKRPLFSAPNLDSQNLIKYSVLTKGRVPGIGSGWKWRKDSTGKVNIGRAITNLPFEYIVGKIAFERLFIGENNKNFDSNKQVIYEGKFERLFRDTMFNYEFSVPLSLSGRLEQLLISDLNTFSPFIMSFEKRSFDCLVMDVVDRVKLPLASNGTPMSVKFHKSTGSESNILELEGTKLNQLIGFIKNYGNLNISVVDHTRSEQSISLRLSLSSSLKDLNEQLLKNGLIIREMPQDLDVLVIRDQINQ